MRSFRAGKEAMCTSTCGRVMASRARAKIVFAWPLSEFVMNNIFFVWMVVPSFVVFMVVGHAESLEVKPSEKPGERQRAWLVTGETSDPNEPGRKRGGSTWA